MINRLFSKTELNVGLLLLLLSIIATIYFSPYALIYGIASAFIYVNNF